MKQDANKAQVLRIASLVRSCRKLAARIQANGSLVSGPFEGELKEVFDQTCRLAEFERSQESALRCSIDSLERVLNAVSHRVESPHSVDADELFRIEPDHHDHPAHHQVDAEPELDADELFRIEDKQERKKE